MSLDRRGARALAAAVVALVAALAYLPSIGGELVMDDRALLDDAAAPERASDLFGRGLFAGARRYGGYYRPLTALSFAAESALGWSRPPLRHATNVLLHAGVAAGAFLLLAALRGRDRSAAVALAAALLFAVHPVGVDAVDPVTGRGDLLAAGLMLASWGAFDARRRRPGGGAGLLLLAAALFAAALLSKESAAVLPVLLLAGAWCADRAAALRSQPGDLLLLLLVLGLYGALRFAVLGGLLEPGLPHPLDNPLAGAGAAARLTGAPAAWIEGARLLIWPLGASPDYSSGALELPASVLDPRALAGWALLLAAVAGWGALARRGGRGFLGLSVLLAAWLPAANLLFTAPVLLAGRVLYLPSLGLALLIAAAGGGVVRRRPRMKVPVLLGGLLLAAAWGGLTLARHATYAGDRPLWERAAARTPANAKAWYNLGNARMRAGEVEAAADAWQRAVELHPSLWVGWSNLGVARARLGRQAEAAEAFRRALAGDPALAQAHAGLGSLLLRRGDVDRGRRHLRLALVWDPHGPEAPTIRELLRRLS